MRRISFDVDDTLTGIAGMPVEPSPRWWWRWWHRPEPLRLGTVAVMNELRRRGCEVWIDSTSYRSPGYLRGWLRAHGVRVAGVVNQNRHDRVVGRRGPSKLPPTFGIHLHVDDSAGVAEEGRRHRFAVVVVPPGDPDWVDRVLAAVGSPAHNGRHLSEPRP